MNCNKCPIKEECGSSTVCPLVILIQEWRERYLSKLSEGKKCRVTYKWEVS